MFQTHLKTAQTRLTHKSNKAKATTQASFKHTNNTQATNQTRLEQQLKQVSITQNNKQESTTNTKPRIGQSIWGKQKRTKQLNRQTHRNCFTKQITSLKHKT